MHDSVFETRDLRTLVTVYELRHFGKAAEQLGVSQPAVSKSIQRLERDLGVLLFDRSRSRVAPTDLCEMLVVRAKQILRGIEDITSTIRMARGLEIGSLAIGVGPAMSETYVTHAITALAENHPGIQLDVRLNHWHELSEQLLEGEIDLVVADVAKVANDQRFRIITLPQEQFIWFCRKGHPLTKLRKVTREHMIRFPIASPRMPPWAIQWFEAINKQGMDEAKIFTALPTIRCESYSIVKRMVMESDCISAALKSTIQSETQNQRLAVISVDAPPLFTNAGILHLRERSLTPVASTFIEYVTTLANGNCITRPGKHTAAPKPS